MTVDGRVAKSQVLPNDNRISQSPVVAQEPIQLLG